MVPGSTLRYGSNFCRLTLSPRLSSRHPSDAAASPLPSDDTTPPVTKIYFAISPPRSQLLWTNLSRASTHSRNENSETRNLFLRLLHPGWNIEWLGAIWGARLIIQSS